MGKIHLLTRKEEIDEQQLTDNKIGVVFDVLLATSTITAALEYGAKEVIPVHNEEEAIKYGQRKNISETILIGEYQGKTIDGFLAPNPKALKDIVSGKTIILSTTNGTVALKKSQKAKKVYAASLLNSKSVAHHLVTNYKDESIILICSGSSGKFNMEDFYGAGYFIDCLLSYSIELEYTDAAKAAHLFYSSNLDKEFEILAESSVGKMLLNYGFEDELKFVSRKSQFKVVPIFENGLSVRNANNMIKVDQDNR